MMIPSVDSRDSIHRPQRVDEIRSSAQARARGAAAQNSSPTGEDFDRSDLISLGTRYRLGRVPGRCESTQQEEVRMQHAQEGP